MSSTVPRIRKTDSPFHNPVQSTRFVEIKCNWFFLTRNDGLQGPFATQASAETALGIYLAELNPNVELPDTPKDLQNYQVDELPADNVLAWKHPSSK